MKKILIFSLGYYPDHVGGAEVAVQEITKRLTGEFEFDLVTLSCGRGGGCYKSYEVIDGVNVHRVGAWVGGVSKILFGAPNSPGDFALLSKIIYPVWACIYGSWLNRNRRYDIAWSIMAAHAGLAGLLFKIFHPKVRYVLNLQEGLSIEDMEKIARPIWPLYRMIFRKADAIHALSKYLADFATKNMEVQKPVIVIPNGVDYAKFSKGPTDQEKEEVRSKYGFSKDDFVLVTTSRLVPKNGVGHVIEAMGLENGGIPNNVKFLIIGQGFLEEKLKERVNSLKLSDRVKFVGFIENNSLPKILAACNAFIRPSLSEGFGVSFVEAMAVGLPVIATQVGGIKDFLIDPTQDQSPNGSLATGLACLPGDSRSIALAISRITQDESLCARLIINARQMVKTRYDWNVIISDIRRVFMRNE